MTIKENFALAPLTTFHIGGPAKFFCVADTVDELTQAVTLAQEKSSPVLILGGGSNVLVSDQGFPGLVINFRPKGLEVIEEDNESAIIKIGSGEVWDEVVQFAVDHNLWGIENLSHIPGLSGGVAVQNVGAYGQEAGNVIVSVEVLDLLDGKVKILRNSQCGFGYRTSVFNSSAKGRSAIISLTMSLSKVPAPNLSYGDVKRYFAEREVATPTQSQIRQAITEIRDRKFPFPKEAKMGNAGSFFRGPILKPEQIEYLYQKVAANFGKEALERLHGMADRLMVDQGMKTPTAFLIELCGLKGQQVGGARVHDDHAAIVVNATGQATAQDVLGLFTHVGQQVYRQTGVMLHIEPELVGFSETEKEQILDSVVVDWYN